MSDRTRIVATVAGVEWTATDVRLRELTMREPAAVLAAFRALDPADVAARLERDGAEQVAIELGVRLATLQGEKAPRVVLDVDLSDAVQAEQPPAPKPTPPAPVAARAPRRARMMPRAGDRHACALEASCLTQIARLHPNASGASCPRACPHLQPSDGRGDRDHIATSRPGAVDF